MEIIAPVNFIFAASATTQKRARSPGPPFPLLSCIYKLFSVCDCLSRREIGIRAVIKHLRGRVWRISLTSCIHTKWHIEQSCIGNEDLFRGDLLDSSEKSV